MTALANQMGMIINGLAPPRPLRLGATTTLRRALSAWLVDMEESPGIDRASKEVLSDPWARRLSRAGPILARFSDWLEVQNRSATPKSLFGQAPWPH